MAEVHVQDAETVESVQRRFKRKVLNDDIIKDVKRHSFHLKPGEAVRLKTAMARKRKRKKQIESKNKGRTGASPVPF